MKTVYSKTWFFIVAVLLLSGLLVLGGCSNNPLNIQPPDTSPAPGGSPAKPIVEAKDQRVAYSFDNTGKVQLSANNLTLKTGQRLILEPAQGFSGGVRFTSSGENFFGAVMKQETEGQDNGRVIFTAIKPGKGKLQVMPSNDPNKITDLWVTVQ